MSCSWADAGRRLRSAAYDGDVAEIRWLLSWGSSLTEAGRAQGSPLAEARDRGGWTPLLYACKAGQASPQRLTPCAPVSDLFLKFWPSLSSHAATDRSCGRAAAARRRGPERGE